MPFLTAASVCCARALSAATCCTSVFFSCHLILQLAEKMNQIKPRDRITAIGTSWMAAASSLWTSRLRPWIWRMKSSRCSHCGRQKAQSWHTEAPFSCQNSIPFSRPLLTCTEAPSNSRRMPSSSSTASSAGHKHKGLKRDMGQGQRPEGR